MVGRDPIIFRAYRAVGHNLASSSGLRLMGRQMWLEIEFDRSLALQFKSTEVTINDFESFKRGDR